MKESSKSALGGIIAALSVSIMLLTYISPFMVYAAPAFAGVLLLIIHEEAGTGWAFGTWAAVSILSMVLIADKESSLYYILIFGLYPLLEDFLRRKIRLLIVRVAVKLLIFNASLAVTIALASFVFHVDYSEFAEKAGWLVITFLILMNVFFFIYDFLLRVLRRLYILKLHKKLLKLFK